MPIVKQLEGPSATITIDRPEALNAMDSSMYRDITDALREIDRNPEILVGIITGAGGRAFSTGADLKEMHLNATADGRWRPWRAERWDLGLSVSKPLIAAIDGYALAGGLELALFCDIRLATGRSQFGTPEIKWNLLHGYGALRLPAIVGMTNAMMLLLTGELIDADEALRIGLINRIVEPEDLMSQARAIAQSIADKASDAVQMTKELALRSVDAPLEQNLRLYHEYMARLEGSDEQLRRTGAFASKSAVGEARQPE
ncbi:MAG TPA: enoyl-CoA hydratase/isomerase family protein [Actinocrinis sp.]|uniref:enoyl-CoA hydratase/isomerase family protein n=1 Tax=Actinocrinis sp. TaxID=1920516 RepID=UPI002D463618|nr:enoyl-CoA hydratase/isomerase family protein [Actinocrinis sp.]HZU55962.1 enoyl-CoA hydratase/isomerase family protein [Actinocrinis sp.]